MRETGDQPIITAVPRWRACRSLFLPHLPHSQILYSPDKGYPQMGKITTTSRQLSLRPDGVIT